MSTLKENLEGVSIDEVIDEFPIRKIKEWLDENAKSFGYVKTNEERKLLNDCQIVSKEVGTIGYEFCDTTIDAFYGCMKAFMENPNIKNKTRENWKIFVKAYM